MLEKLGRESIIRFALQVPSGVATANRLRSPTGPGEKVKCSLMGSSLIPENRALSG
jgi:hypothetical protein